MIIRISGGILLRMPQTLPGSLDSTVIISRYHIGQKMMMSLNSKYGDSRSSTTHLIKLLGTLIIKPSSQE
jgi:hypothetical protein